MGMRKRVSLPLAAVMLLLLIGLLTIVVSAGRVSRAAAATAVCEPALNVMPVGDSITEGVGSSHDAGYRLPLFNEMNTAVYNFDFVGQESDGAANPGFDPDHEGYGGVQTQYIRFRIPDIHNNNNPDVVLLHLGTNDFAIINAGHSEAEINGFIDDAVANMDLILDNIDNYESNNGKIVTVFVARIINQACDEANLVCARRRQATMDYNVALQAMIAARNDDDIIVVDMETGANLIYEVEPDGDFVDPLHPNDDGYEKMADLWFTALHSSGVMTCGAPEIYSDPVTLVGVAQTYQYQVAVTNGSGASYSLTTNPTGMQIDTGGLITWTPTGNQLGKHDVTVQVQNGNGSDTQQFEVEVKLLLYLPMVLNQ